MLNYKITYSTESGRFCIKTFSGDGDNEAVECFENWAEGCREILQFESCQEVE